MRRTSLIRSALQFIHLRWWIMGFASLILVSIEVFEHVHPTGQIDAEFLPEVVGFGFIFPFIGALILTVVDWIYTETQRSIIHTERQRIARELHDSVGQNLGYLHLKLEFLALNDKLDEATLQELQRIRSVVDDAYEQIRRALVNLDSGDSTDIAAALFDYARLLGRKSDFEVEFAMTGKPAALSLDQQLQILHICREALVNVEKHAGAHKVSLRFEWTSDTLRIQLEDDGKGFDMAAQPPEGHFGLKYMRQRAEEIGASLIVLARPGEGSRVSLFLPYKAGKEKRPQSDGVSVQSVTSYDKHSTG